MVVVVAMAEKKKGDKVESIKHTFARSDSGGVVTNISYSVDCNIQPSTEYILDIVNNGRTHVDTSEIEPFRVTTHNESNNTFNIPKRLIDKHGIRPGHNVKINIYEPAMPADFVQDFTDDASVIGRTEVIGDSDNKDGCACRLQEKATYEYLSSGKKSITFRNVEKKKEKTSVTSQNKVANRFSFPISVREDIDAEPGDLIELIKPRDEDVDKSGDKEKIDEMYEMISELYEAYTAAKND